MAPPDGLSVVGRIARDHDPDRFLCALFAPAARREAVFTLVALNHELARAREVASKPLVALIRLQWWRDAIEEAGRGAPARRHEVAGPVAALVRDGVVGAEDLLALVDAREPEAEGPPPDRAALLGRARAVSGGLAALTGRVLGAPEGALPTLAGIGAAYGVAGILRSLPVHAAAGRNPLPADEVAAAGGATDGAVDLRHPATAAIARTLAAGALEGLEASAREVPGALGLAMAAALTGSLARRDLRRVLRRAWRPEEMGPRGLGDRLAVLRAAALKRI